MSIWISALSGWAKFSSYAGFSWKKEKAWMLAIRLKVRPLYSLRFLTRLGSVMVSYLSMKLEVGAQKKKKRHETAWLWCGFLWRKRGLMSTLAISEATVHWTSRGSDGVFRNQRWRQDVAAAHPGLFVIECSV